MTAHDELLVKGHIYRVKRSVKDPSLIALYLGYDVCLIFQDCKDCGSSPVDTWSRMSDYIVEQDVTEEYEFGLEEIAYPWLVRSLFYRWKVRTRNYEGVRLFNISHAISRMKVHFRYGVHNIFISDTGAFTFQEGRFHVSGIHSADDLALQGILLELLTRGVYGDMWE